MAVFLEIIDGSDDGTGDLVMFLLGSGFEHGLIAQILRELDQLLICLLYTSRCV